MIFFMRVVLFVFSFLSLGTPFGDKKLIRIRYIFMLRVASHKSEYSYFLMIQK